MTHSSTGRTLRRVGGLATAAGTLFIAAGAAAWLTVTKQLQEEKITVPGNSKLLPGRPVQGPATAFAEAQIIKQNAERGSGGRTFADISDALRGLDGASDEARELRNQSSALSTAAALRTSLMTSVLAYGVSAFIAGLGLLLTVMGCQLRRSED